MLSFRSRHSSFTSWQILASALLTTVLSGCATLPSSGPTGGQLAKSAQDAVPGQTGIRLVELNDLASLPTPPRRMSVFLPDYVPPPTNLIGPNDLLDIAIYEAGVSLFGGATTITTSNTTSLAPSVRVEKLPPLRVDDDGGIKLPYLGSLHAAGRTTVELAAMIRRAYKGMSQNPQVLVTLQESVNNAVVVGGEVGKPGRQTLITTHETLSDIIASAGSYRGEAKDIAVRVQRNGMMAEYRLSDVLATPGYDAKIYPGDKVALIRAPQSFSVLGAPGKVEQISFSLPSLSLTEALATAGGANPNIGDPAAVFVLRYVVDDQGQEEAVVYHLDMTRTSSFFLAQKFAMRDKDILYIGNARANQPSKLVQIISQLFAPIVTVRNIASPTN